MGNIGEGGGGKGGGGKGEGKGGGGGAAPAASMPPPAKKAGTSTEPFPVGMECKFVRYQQPRRCTIIEIDHTRGVDKASGEATPYRCTQISC